MAEPTAVDMTDSQRLRLRIGPSSFPRRLVRGLQLMGLFVVGPLVVGSWLGPDGAGAATMLGAVMVLGSSLVNGRRLSIYVAPVILGAMILGALARPGWGWVLLVTVLAAVSGLATMRGAGVAMSMATLYAVTAPEFTDAGRLAVLAAFSVLGGTYAWFMAGRIGATWLTPAPSVDRRTALVIATGLALAVGLAATVAVVTDWPRATWMVAAVVVLGVPTPGLTERLIGQRLLGQLLACGAVALVALLTDSTVILLLAACVSLLLYLTSLQRPLVEQIAYLSAAFMLPVTASTSASIVVAQRLGYNLLGLAILAAAVLFVRLADGRPET